MKTLHTVLALATVLSANVAFGFSRQGHEAIAELAYESPDLTKKAHDAIAQILGPNETIMFAAEWPDAIKPRQKLHDTDEAKAFNAKHGKNTKWHFINFPIGATKYSETDPFALPTDIAVAIRGCITVLEGGDFDGLTQKEALRFLVHLVGDVHQPLHTTFEQWDVTDHQHPKMLTPVPDPAKSVLMDGGANDLYYTSGQELHAMWDDDLVEAIVHDNSTATLVAALKPEVSKTKYLVPSSDYKKWVDAWLSDSMALVPDVYAGITYGEYVEVLDEHGKVKTRKIMVTLPKDYKADHVKVAHEQVVKAASHLLQLFNAIKWAPHS